MILLWSLSAHWANVGDKHDIWPGLPFFRSVLFNFQSLFQRVPCKMLFCLLETPFFALAELTSSAYIFRVIFPCLLNLPPWTVTTRIPSQTYKLTPPSTTGFNQFSSVNIRKQTLLHFQRDPGKCARYKERNACLPEGPPTPTPAWTVNKINFTSKGCE